jgi:hypothetical protein
MQFADAPCGSGWRFGAGTFATGCLEPCGKMHRGGYGSGEQDKDELTDLVRPTAAEDDFRGQAFATEARVQCEPSVHMRGKIACRGAPGTPTLVAKPSRLASLP